MVSSIEPLILAVILLASRTFGVPATLIAAVIDVESSWNLHALGDYDENSVPHAFSLMQVNDKGAGVGWTQDQLLDPYLNIFVGTDYLKSCINMYPNNLRLAISAYNQGMAGAAFKGWSANKIYVENVLASMKKYEEEIK